MAALLARIGDIRFLRYVLASIGALAVDVLGFMALLALGVPAVLAATTGYAAGILAHWLLSSRKVFTGMVAPVGRARTRQKGLFVLSALVGLGLTAAIVGLGEAIGIDPRLSKLVAIAMSFFVTWGIRSRIVFSTRSVHDAVGG